MQVPRLLPIVVLALVTLGAAHHSNAQTRIAMIVGNGKYQHATKLPNPSNDATALSAAFGRLGYDVIEAVDLSQQEFVARLQLFSDRMENAEVAVFFYAGHGLQIDGKNFLLPIDFDVKRSIPLSDQMVLIDSIVEDMARRAQHSLIFLDACRNNPFAETLKATLGRGVKVLLDSAQGAKVVGRGLAEFKGGKGTLIAYATQPGNIASDGQGRNSPFTLGLLKNIEEPGLEVRQMLTKVRASVVAETRNEQIPWDHSSLLANFYLKKIPRPIIPPP